MKDEERLDKILGDFRAVVDTAYGLEIGDLVGHSDAAKELSHILVEMEYSRISFHEKWSLKSFEFSGSKAAGDRLADIEVPQLYKLRHLMNGGYQRLAVIRGHINTLKQEK